MTTATQRHGITPDPHAIQFDIDRQVDLPRSFQRPESQASRELVHIERRTDNQTGEITDLPRLNRKGRRKDEALARRKSIVATRPMTKRELQEHFLNKYEDSLEAKKPVSAKRRGKKLRRAKGQQVGGFLPETHQSFDHEPVKHFTPLRRAVARAATRAIRAIGF